MGKKTTILTTIKKAWNIVAQVQRDKATGMLEFQLKEMENLFTIFLYGSFIGLPAPPAPIAIELLPYMEKELALMISRADFAKDPLGSIVGMLGLD